MIYPKIPLAQSIIEICHAKGVHDIIISPGSRNAPLTIGFTNNPKFNCYSIADERCAAFFALGIAQQTQRPVAVVCTSGSALLNYYPALAEAFYSQIPFVVISADGGARLLHPAAERARGDGLHSVVRRYRAPAGSRGLPGPASHGISGSPYADGDSAGTG